MWWWAGSPEIYGRDARRASGRTFLGPRSGVGARVAKGLMWLAKSVLDFVFLGRDEAKSFVFWER